MAKQRIGDINDVDALRSAKIFSTATVSSYFPGKIGVTDVDGAVERRGNFLWWEFKTLGTSIPRGQKIFFERLLASQSGHSHLITCTHRPLSVVRCPEDLVNFRVYWHQDGPCWTKTLKIPLLRVVIDRWNEQVDTRKPTLQEWLARNVEPEKS